MEQSPPRYLQQVLIVSSNTDEPVGRSLGASLQILDLGLGASEIEAKVKYRQLARIYHPDKNNQATTGLTKTMGK